MIASTSKIPVRPATVLLLAAILLGIAGCKKDPIGPIPPGPIQFDLVLPDNVPNDGAYYAVSGALIKDDYAPDTSMIMVPVTKYYAEFRGIDTGVNVPTVLLNDMPLERNLGGDTLRLAAGSGVGIFDVNTWKVIAPGTTDTTAFSVNGLVIPDSLGPFYTHSPNRSDTLLTVTWNRSNTSTGAMIIWKTSTHTYSKQVIDAIGSETVPMTEIAKLRGSGTIRFIRYGITNAIYKGKKVVVVRLAERMYNTIVQ